MKTLTYKQMWGWLLLAGLLSAAACAGGGYGGPVGASYYGPSPSVRPYDYSPYPGQDPQYWQLWQDSQGGG